MLSSRFKSIFSIISFSDHVWGPYLVLTDNMRCPSKIHPIF